MPEFFNLPIDREYIPPLLAICFIIMAIVAAWPSDMTVQRGPTPPKDDESEKEEDGDGDDSGPPMTSA